MNPLVFFSCFLRIVALTVLVEFHQNWADISVKYTIDVHNAG